MSPPTPGAGLESFRAGRWEGGDGLGVLVVCLPLRTACMSQGFISMATGAHCAETLPKGCVELGRKLLLKPKTQVYWGGEGELGPPDLRQARQAEMEVSVFESRARGSGCMSAWRGADTNHCLCRSWLQSVVAMAKDLGLGLTMRPTYSERASAFD